MELDTKFDSSIDATLFLEHCIDADFEVISVDQKPGKRNPSAPLTTSTLQQAAASAYGYPVGKTMQLAQRLYEAGHITYMRTDSTNLSNKALSMITKEVEKRWGKKYHQYRTYSKKSKSAQEAHEAIRPTKMSADSAGTDTDQQKIYKLIWSRTMASQMSSASTLKTQAKISISTRTEQFLAT